METQENNQKKQTGFTLIEVLVAIASSTVVLGGFLIAFSSLNKVSRQSDREIAQMSKSNNARMLISKVLSGANLVEFKTITSSHSCCSGEDFDVLYYYKYDETQPLGAQDLEEYGFFYVDEQQTSDSSYDPNMGSSDILANKNLYFQRYVKDSTGVFPDGGSYSNAADIQPEDFNFRAADRYLALSDVQDFVARVAVVNSEAALETNYQGRVQDRTQKFNIDYQITSAYEEGGLDADGSPAQRAMAFKGSTYVMGRVTKG